MYSYRNARQDDFNMIVNFPQTQKEAFYMYPRGEYPFQAEQLYKTALSRELPTVIHRLGEIVGYGNLYDVAEADDCWLGNVIVHPNYRRQGVGQFLIEVMIQRAKEELRVREINLIVHNTNTKALLLYNKFGFRPFDIIAMNDSEGHEIAGIAMRIKV